NPGEPRLEEAVVYQALQVEGGRRPLRAGRARGLVPGHRPALGRDVGVERAASRLGQGGERVEATRPGTRLASHATHGRSGRAATARAWRGRGTRRGTWRRCASPRAAHW